MRVTEIPQGKVSLSLEMFPPKKEENLPKFIENAHKMATLRPDFISVTYGAGGGTTHTTLALASEIQKDVSVVAHLNCDGLTGTDLRAYLNRLRESNVENVLALRGDKFDSKHFSGSVDLINAIRRERGFCIGAACYPEGHPDSGGWEKDFDFYKIKMESGCEFFVTQMCFSCDKIAAFVDTMHMALGPKVRVRIGLMPILKKQTLWKARSLGVSVPGEFQPLLDADESDEVFRKWGIHYCISQINILISWGFTNIHLYTMNDYEATRDIICGSSIRPYLFK